MLQWNSDWCATWSYVVELLVRHSTDNKNSYCVAELATTCPHALVSPYVRMLRLHVTRTWRWNKSRCGLVPPCGSPLSGFRHWRGKKESQLWYDAAFINDRPLLRPGVATQDDRWKSRRCRWDQQRSEHKTRPGNPLTLKIDILERGGNAAQFHRRWFQKWTLKWTRDDLAAGSLF